MQREFAEETFSALTDEERVQFANAILKLNDDLRPAQTLPLAAGPASKVPAQASSRGVERRLGFAPLPAARPIPSRVSRRRAAGSDLGPLETRIRVSLSAASGASRRLFNVR